jgi:hypothetical protein
VNVEDGVVVLRGEVERSTQILEIEGAVRRIPDVLDVQNLLHRPGEIAPNKAEAMRSERPPAPPDARTEKPGGRRARTSADRPPKNATELPAA